MQKSKNVPGWCPPDGVHEWCRWVEISLGLDRADPLGFMRPENELPRPEHLGILEPYSIPSVGTGGKPVVSRETIVEAAALLANAASPARVILFGSHARGDAGPDSDVDFLVVEPIVENRCREMVRLRRVLRPLRIPVDILVASQEEVEDWGVLPGTTLYWALAEGEELHETAA